MVKDVDEYFDFGLRCVDFVDYIVEIGKGVGSDVYYVVGFEVDFDVWGFFDYWLCCYIY